jgi:UDP-N-acetylmuramate--alanine ligase
MRALAEVLLGRGWKLSGCDLALGTAGKLAQAGIRLYEGHCAEHVCPDTDLVVFSDAVPPENPELRRAAQLGIPACSYFQMLGRLMAGRRGLAVAGTHGKSTTTAMAAELLIEAGRDPTVLCGAAPLGRVTGGRAGRGDLMLVEACEYRANFLHLRPKQAAILGVEPDHFDCYDSLDALEQAFACFAASIPADGLLLARHDCPLTRRIAAELRCRVETFGIGGREGWSAENLAARRGRYRFEIRRRGRRLCEVRLQVPGRHNVLNALAAAALAWENGAAAEHISAALGRFRGLGRRLERLGTWAGVTVLDDYAHHPTEVTVTLQTIRQMFPGRRVWCVFQPHQASRTARLLDELAESLQNADVVVVAEIFRAREGPCQSGEVTAADLARRVKQRAEAAGQRARPGEVAAVHTSEEIVDLLQSRLKSGDVLSTMGAGDIRKIAEGVQAHLDIRHKAQKHHGLANGFRKTAAAG